MHSQTWGRATNDVLEHLALATVGRQGSGFAGMRGGWGGGKEGEATAMREGRAGEIGRAWMEQGREVGARVAGAHTSAHAELAAMQEDRYGLGTAWYGLAGLVWLGGIMHEAS